jgi:hypothetical protein
MRSKRVHKGLRLLFPGLMTVLLADGTVATTAIAAEVERKSPSRVDFAYAFATPHRMTVGRPDNSDRTLLDAEPGKLRMAWTYENLLNVPLASYTPKSATWSVRLQPQIDGKPFPGSAWTRAEGILPVLENVYTDPQGAMHLEVTGAESAAVIRITLANTGSVERRFSLSCTSERGFFGYNPGYVDPARDRDHLLAGWNDRADRVLVVGLGADEYPVSSALTTSASVVLSLAWKVPPGQRRAAWLVRPYRAYAADLPALRTRNWEDEVKRAKGEWRTLLGRSVRVQIPDPGVEKALYACLGDLFIMREPVADGYVAAVPGTECYRATNSGEAAIVAVALDQLGLHKESAGGFQMCLDQQDDDGDWADPKGWCHLIWCVSGFKAWAAMEHFRLTQDREYLAKVYPRMAASSRWQERQRARTRVMIEGKRPLTYGLMPRGMGDCGLKDDDSLYGFFLPHNIWAVFADRLSVEASECLGKTDDLPELRRISQTALADLRRAIEGGAISAQGYRWIPGVPGKASGSRWGALNALFPCGILAADHDLITGTIRQIRSRMSPGGLPLNTGWLANGMWVAIALDNLAEVHLVRGEGDEAAALLYATLNHATPLYTWCEERGPEPGAREVTGDRQHLWTPVALVRAIRDSLIMEQPDGLHLAVGIDHQWLGSGKPVGITDGPTHFGRVSYHIQYDPEKKRVTGEVAFPKNSHLKQAMLHVRLPGGQRFASVDAASGATVLSKGAGLLWKAPRGEVDFEAEVK